jgi:hypothetical protein
MNPIRIDVYGIVSIPYTLDPVAVNSGDAIRQVDGFARVLKPTIRDFDFRVFCGDYVILDKAKSAVFYYQLGVGNVEGTPIRNARRKRAGLAAVLKSAMP